MPGKKSDRRPLPGREASKGQGARARIMNWAVRAIEKRTPLPAGIDIDSLNYVDTGYVDSIEMIRFVLEVESEFGIEITAGDMELAGFKTIGGLVSMINAKLEDAGGAND